MTLMCICLHRWVQLRHMHIADAINHVIDDFNVFVKDNKAAAIAKGEVETIGLDCTKLTS